jgi:outer membrane protein assembly factor BamB
MMNTKTTLVLSALALIAACNTPTSNWDQYLGPDRNATISGTEILGSWSEKGPKELWSFPLGEGYGGAAIYGDEVFILDRKKGESDIMRCLDLNTGAEIWNYSYEAKGEISFPGSRTVPTVDEKYIWSVGPHGDFYCFDKETRKPIWKHNLLEDFDRELTTWGVSQSPLILDDLIIVAPHGQKAGVAAFEKTTGELVWKTRALSGHPSHVSPTLASFGGLDQVIMISPFNRQDSTLTHEVVAFDAKSGKEIWQYLGLKSFLTVTPALVIDDQRLMLTDCSFDKGYNPVSIMLDITKTGEDFIVKELFLTEEAGCKMHPAVQYENHLYLNHNGNPNQMMCLTMEGEVVWEKDSAPGFEMGAMILVNGLIINQNGKNGDIHLIEPSPEGYKELGKASFFSSSKSQAWAPLAFSQGKLIIRDLEKMVCVDLMKLAD